MISHSKRGGFETLTLGLWLSIVISCCVIALQFLIQTRRTASQAKAHKDFRQVQAEINNMHLHSQRGSRYWRVDSPGHNNCRVVGVDFGGSLQTLSAWALRPPCPTQAKGRISRDRQKN